MEKDSMLPLRMRELLNRIHHGLSMDINAFIKEKITEKIDLDSFIILQVGLRHIKFQINGKTFRYNFNSKEDVVNQEFYWLKHRSEPSKYKTAVINKREEAGFIDYVIGKPLKEIDWSLQSIPERCWSEYKAQKAKTKDFTIWNGDDIQNFSHSRAKNTINYIRRNSGSSFFCKNVFFLSKLLKIVKEKSENN